MSIAVLTQVYDETRRLAIAGSVVAGGDFRLKKLIAPLEQAGAKAPVFAKAAEATKALVESNEQTSAQALLDVCTLVSAVLYTQGETGLAGELKPIEITDLGMQTTQASARVLKPLLEALSTTGSGRLEIIRDSHDRGAFRDLRLVKPALQALDDVYPEIADFIADKVLPLYGKAILPELKSTFDIKGRGGHPRRLSLMHRLDPADTRETVKQALENGSKEIKIVAIECLGAQPEDLTFLLEQAAAKAKDVRGAALKALAKLDADEALEALKKGLTGADLDQCIHPVRENRNPKLLKFVIDETQKELDNVCQSKDKKAIAKSSDRVESLLHCIDGRDDKVTEAFLLKCFDRRAELLGVNCEDVGTNLNNRIASLMSSATKKTQQMLVNSHASLDPDTLDTAFDAACRSMKPVEVFNMFSPYLTAKVDEKKKGKDPAFAKREAIAEAITNDWRWRRHHHRVVDDGSEQKPISWDPRWLDLAVGLKNLQLVSTLARPGHAGANALLSEAFATNFKKSKVVNDCDWPLATMVRVQHPDAVSSLVAVLAKHATPKAKYTWGVYWVARLIPDLPKSAAPILEELLPTLHEKAIDELVEHVTALKNKAT